MATNKTKELILSDYLIIFLSIIVAYVVSEFLSGWGSIFRNPENVKMYWMHLFWTGLAFALIIEIWWGMWSWRARISKNILNFFIVLLNPIIFYFMSLLLFPKIPSYAVLNFKKYFYENNTIIFCLFSFIILYLVFNSLLFSEKESLLKENWIRIVAIGFLILGAIFKNKVYHTILPFIALILFICFILCMWRVIPKNNITNYN